MSFKRPLSGPCSMFGFGAFPKGSLFRAPAGCREHSVCRADSCPLAPAGPTPAHAGSEGLVRANTRHLSQPRGQCSHTGSLKSAPWESVSATAQGIFFFVCPREPVNQHIAGHCCLLTHPGPSLTCKDPGAHPAPSRAHPQHDVWGAAAPCLPLSFWPHGS